MQRPRIHCLFLRLPSLLLSCPVPAGKAMPTKRRSSCRRASASPSSALVSARRMSLAEVAHHLAHAIPCALPPSSCASRSHCECRTRTSSFLSQPKPCHHFGALGWHACSSKRFRAGFFGSAREAPQNAGTLCERAQAGSIPRKHFSWNLATHSYILLPVRGLNEITFGRSVHLSALMFHLNSLEKEFDTDSTCCEPNNQPSET